MFQKLKKVLYDAKFTLPMWVSSLVDVLPQNKKGPSFTTFAVKDVCAKIPAFCEVTKGTQTSLVPLSG